MNKSFEYYAGLTAVPGVRLAQCSVFGIFSCPFCNAENVAVLAGKVSFTAKMSGEDFLADVEHPLAGFMCEKGHLFFVRECDVPLSVDSLNTA